jgi:hypothetical protein
MNYFSSGKREIWFYSNLNFKTILINLLKYKCNVTLYKLYSYKQKNTQNFPTIYPVVWIIIVFCRCESQVHCLGKMHQLAVLNEAIHSLNQYARFQVISAVLHNITSSGKWSCVVRRVVPDVSKYRNACFFMSTHYVNSNVQKVLAEWSRVISEKKRIFNTCLPLMVNNIHKLFIGAVKHNNIFRF